MYIHSFTSPRIHLRNLNVLLQLFSLLILFGPPQISHAATIVESLPGYAGNLPFCLSTGYIGVGEEEPVQLFYYFIESERAPKTDPVLIWMTGGPGCSSLSGLMLENGPLSFSYSPASWQSEIPKLKLNPYSWTKVASMIFVDAPAGTGFSYATTAEGYYSDDITASRHIYEFLKKWLQEHAEFQNNPIYIAGDSYSGITVPLVVQEILNGNKAAIRPLMNLKGYILGNPLTSEEDVLSSRYKYAHRMSLLSDELYEETRVNCRGTYDTVDAGNTRCQKDLEAVSNALDPLYRYHILEPTCTTSIPPKWCRDRDYHLFYVWANNLKVREALHIREGTKIHWARCNFTQAFTQAHRRNVLSSVDYHRNFTKEPLHALIYSGDQDLSVPYVDTLAWIVKLNVSTIDRWRPWLVKGQVAGYTTKHSNGHYRLTFSTVKGAGHTAPEYKPQECQLMFIRWLSMHPLD
uniref:Serine carboxypeptidase-like 18 n=1 Tax=Opuntia streptacantha TaxID=393608 RepID=A0A7C9ELY0_OPUST